MDRDKLIAFSVFGAVLTATTMALSAKSAPDGPAGPVQAAPASQTTGVITGKVTFEGTPPKRASIIMDKDPVCAAKYTEPPLIEDGAVSAGGTLPDVFVYVKNVPGNFAPPAEPVILDQHGCRYEPHVLGIMVGQELRIVSSDATTHNIHPMPKGNREWNQSQPPGAAPLVKKFAQPEVMIPVKCNQHPWMRAYVGVTRNPFYAVTGSDGTFTLRGLPPGQYVLVAWTATFGTQEQKIMVDANTTTQAEFVFRAP